VFILWFGWFGFNPGSTLSGLDPAIAQIALNTNISAAAGALLAMSFSWIRYGKPDVGLTLNGALAGLVGITAGCADVNLVPSVLIGAGAGVLIILGVEFIEKVPRVDDPVGAVAVHGVCGIYGTLMVGLFATEGGLLFGGGAGLLLVQAAGVLAVAAWTVSMAYLLFKGIKVTVGLRVSVREEEEGLDLGEHGIEAYADFVKRGTQPLVS
jgi:Amt family ammonium transporter